MAMTSIAGHLYRGVSGFGSDIMAATPRSNLSASFPGFPSSNDHFCPRCGPIVPYQRRVMHWLAGGAAHGGRPDTACIAQASHGFDMSEKGLTTTGSKFGRTLIDGVWSIMTSVHLISPFVPRQKLERVEALRDCGVVVPHRPVYYNYSDLVQAQARYVLPVFSSVPQRPHGYASYAQSRRCHRSNEPRAVG